MLPKNLILVTIITTFYSVINTQNIRFPDPNESPIFTANRRRNDLDCKSGFVCKELIKCSVNTFENSNQIKNCTLPTTIGICCPVKTRLTNNNVPKINMKDSELGGRRRKPVAFPEISDENLRITQSKVTKHMRNMEAIEEELAKRNLVSPNSVAEEAHQNFFGNSHEARKLGLQGEQLIQFAKQLKTDLNLNTEQTRFGLANLNSRQSNRKCPVEPRCSDGKYRTADGSCNNRNHPSWGKALTPFNRVLPPDYADGLTEPRVSKQNQNLPGTRDISTILGVSHDTAFTDYTLALIQFGQFIDHDIALTTVTRTRNGSTIPCCSREIQRNPQLKHPACFEIKIRKDDYFYSKFKQTCMNFVRSSAATRLNCALGPREQTNQLTSFIDGSMIYGSSKEVQQSLRTFNGGRLLSSIVNQEIFLPSAINGTCNVPNNVVQQCFRGGEPRTNENIDLTVFQTVFLREHNRIASELEILNPSWTDNLIFEETRKIIGAILQHITYNEFLPPILGPYIMDSMDLFPQDNGYFTKYDIHENPSIFSSFTTAAYRFHSMVNGNLLMMNNNGVPIGSIPLSQTFNNPSLLRIPDVYDGLINGLTTQSMLAQDILFSQEITNKLFKPFNVSFGIDLMAINIQRGRDHGIPGYNEWRAICGMNRIRNFRELITVMKPEIAQILSQIYSQVDDIDLFVAGVAENHLPRSQLGPTFACIVVEQFKRLKFGDRFYYENGNQENSFTLEQLNEIRKISMARLFCDNGDNIAFMQPFAFVRPLFWWNQKVLCRSGIIPRLSLLPWSSRRMSDNYKHQKN